MPGLDCISETDLRAFQLGELPSRVAALIADHLDACPDCAARADHLDSAADACVVHLRRAAGQGSSLDLPEPTPAPRSATTPGDASFPRWFGDFELLGALGAGGMSVVYLARQRRPDRIVALKMILAGRQADAERRARFLAEADAIGRLQHPNIIQIYQAGEHDGQLFLALEWLDGGNLEQLLDGHPQDPAVAAALVEQLAQAVQHAHGHGIIHRDLKPANVLLTFGRPPAARTLAAAVPKIGDFGLAKQDEVSLTASGALLGTPAYMAPEQAGGDKGAVGPAADIYALGAILYELLTGRPPFQAASTLETLDQVRSTEPVPPTHLQPKVPRDLETICLKCLHKEPGRRYAHASDLADDLEAFGQGRPIQARPVGTGERVWRWARRNPGWAAMLSAVFALLLLIAAGASLGAARLNALLRRAQGAEADLTDKVARLQQAERATQEKLFDSYVEKARALRHSQRLGQRFDCLDTIGKAVELALGLDRPAERLHALRNEAASALALLDLRLVQQWVGATHDHRIAFDPELKRYARCDHAGTVSVRRVPDDHELLRLAGLPAPDAPWPSFSPDGQHLSVWHEQGGKINVWRLDRTAATLVWDGAASGQGMPSFAPDGRALVCPLPDGSVELVNLASGGTRRLPAADGARGFPYALPIAVHPDGHRFALATHIGPQSVVQVRECDTGRVLDTLRGARKEFAHPVWHPSGQILAVTDSGSVRLWDAVARTWTAEFYASHTGGIRLAFSHAGDLLAGTDWNGETRFWEPQSGLLVFKADTRLASVQFSPDDRFLAGRVWDNITRTLRVWEVARPCYRRLRSLPVGEGIGEGIYTALAVSPGDALLAAGVRDGVALWDLGSLRPVAFLPGLGRDTRGLAFDATGALWSFGASGLCRWPVNSPGAAPATIGPPTLFSLDPRADADPLSMDHAGKVLAIRTKTGSWALHVGPPERRLRLAARPEDGIAAVSPNGSWIAVTDLPGQKVRILDPGRGKLLRELPLDAWGSLGFSPDGRWLWAPDKKLQFHLWRTVTWERTSAVAPRLSLAFAPDSQTLAVETGDARIRLLNPDTRNKFVVLEDPNQDVTYGGMTFSHDGTRLITISHRATQAIHIWDLRRLRQELATLGLDWEQEPYPTAAPAVPSPVRFLVDRGRLPLPPEAGLIAYSLAIALQPLNPAAYTERAAAFANLERDAEALADCDRALALAPASARAWFVRGQAHEKLGNRRQALADYGQAIRHGPAEVSYRQARLAVAEVLHERMMVQQDLDWLIERQAATPLILHNRAWDLLIGPADQRDPLRALGLVRQAIEQDPHTPIHLTTLGVALYRTGSYQEARVILEQSLERGKGAADAFDLFFLAMCHARLGNQGQAAQCFARAVRWREEHQGRLSALKAEELRAIEAEAGGVLE
jgi:WD40 repeat protein/Tfp pilus assembly protein PilF/tRNA A-37 threonylcarbamoyl transferase component Bud32